MAAAVFVARINVVDTEADSSRVIYPYDSASKGVGKGGDPMERYEVRQISPLTWGIYDHEEDEIILETTRKGVEVYAEMMGLEE